MNENWMNKKNKPFQKDIRKLLNELRKGKVSKYNKKNYK